MDKKNIVEIFPWILQRFSGLRAMSAMTLVQSLGEFAAKEGLLGLDLGKLLRARIQIEQQQLVEALGSKELDDAISHSNAGLPDRLRKHLSVPKGGSKRERRALLQARRTAARFITRAAFKTSPFAALGTVALRNLTETVQEHRAEGRRRFTLNAEVGRHFAALVEGERLACGMTRVVISPSCSWQDGWLYSRTTYGGSDRIRRTKCNNWLTKIFDLCDVVEFQGSDLLGKEYRLPRLRDAVELSDTVVARLIEVGILERRLTVSLIDSNCGDGTLELIGRIEDWLAGGAEQDDHGLSGLIEFLLRRFDHAKRRVALGWLTKLLIDLELQTRSRIGSESRWEMRDRMGSRRDFYSKNFNTSGKSIQSNEIETENSMANFAEDRSSGSEQRRDAGGAVLPVASENLVYEDVARGPVEGPSKSFYRNIHQDLAGLVSVLFDLKNESDQFWSGWKWAEGQCRGKVVPVMALYRGWLASELGEQDLSFDEESSFFKEFESGLQLTRISGEAIHLEVDYNMNQRGLIGRYGIIGQCIYANNEGIAPAGFVVNHLIPGGPRYLSRFLPLFDPAVVKDFIDWQKPGENYPAEAELVDRDLFNSNIHPCLTPRQIIINGEYGVFRDCRAIPVSQLGISYDVELRSFRFISLSDGEEVLPRDYGFMGFQKRSGVSRFILRIAGQTGLPFAEVVDHLQLRSCNPDSVSVSYYPQLNIGKHTVLARRRWKVHQPAVLLARSSEGLSDYYQRIRRWLDEFSIPLHVFIRAAGEGFVDLSGKPQFINFDSPVCLEILVNAVRGLKGRPMMVEEALPSPGCGAATDGYCIEEYVNVRIGTIS